jgi:hypothetical protein
MKAIRFFLQEKSAHHVLFEQRPTEKLNACCSKPSSLQVVARRAT